MISFLISLVIVLVIASVVFYLIELIVPSPYIKIARAVLAGLVLIWLLCALTGRAPRVPFERWG